MKRCLAGALAALFVLTACAQQGSAVGEDLNINRPEPASAETTDKVPNEYSEEIRLKNVPWGIGPDAVCALLNDDSFIYIENQNMRTWENIDSWTGDYVVKPYGHYLFQFCSDSVAGYPLSKVELFFMYDIDSGDVNRDSGKEKFYLAKYTFSILDIDNAYMDLRGKLASLYGDGEEAFKSNDRFSVTIIGGGVSGNYTIFEKSTVWYGANDTAVRLVSRVSDSEELGAFDAGLWIFYGKIDSSVDLKALSDLLTAEAFREESESRDAENMNGLY